MFVALDHIEGLYKKIDHVAIAVHELEEAISFYRDVLGLELMERRETQGKKSGMISAVMSAGHFTIVLLQGSEPESQVSQYVSNYGPGVQHIAFEVDQIEPAVEILKNKGFEFATNIITGNALRQAFSKRDINSGMMIELIERNAEIAEFEDNNVNDLFSQLETAELV